MARNRAHIDHPSVVALMREAKPGEAAADVIRRKCRDLVAHGKSQGWAGPPFNPRHLASILSIKVEETEEEFPGDGRIFPRREHVVIQVRKGQMEERQRFTICHELAHTCFPDAFEFVRHHQDDSLAADPGYRAFENLCDIGAGEILFPHEDFLPDLGRQKVSLPHAVSLAARYRASIDATLNRLLGLTTHSCAAAFLTDQAFDDFRAVPGRWRVKFFWKSETYRGFLPRGTLLPARSCAGHATSTPSMVFPSARETWWINDQPRSWYVEPLRLPIVANKDYARIVALLHARRP